MAENINTIRDLVTRIDTATTRSSVTNVMVAKVLEWLLTHTDDAEDLLAELLSRITAQERLNLDDEAVRARSTDESSYPLQTARVEVVDIDTFSQMRRMEAGTLYIVTNTSTIDTPQTPTNPET